MMDDKYSQLVIKYVQNELTSEEKKQFDELIASGNIDIDEIRDMESLFGTMDSISIPNPSEKMQHRFYEMLEEEKQINHIIWSAKVQQWLNHQLSSIKLKHVMYAAAIFLGGLFIGDMYSPVSQQNNRIEQLTTEVSQMREMMMISLIENSSPSERLKAVNISHDITSADNRVIVSLLQTLNTDSNVNVRLAAVDALADHASKNPEVREGLIQSITGQESPIVQIALADAMLMLQEEQSINEFKKLLERDELDMNVRNKLENTIAALN